MCRHRVSRQGAATTACLLVPVIAPRVRPSLSPLQWLSLQGLGALLSPGLRALCREVSSRSTALAGHCGWERAGDFQGLPRAEGWAELSGSQQLGPPVPQLPGGTPAAAPAGPGCFLAVHDPTAPHNVFLGVLPGSFGDAKTNRDLLA